MNNEFLRLIKKHTDTPIEQTKTKPQKTLEFELNSQTEIFPFNPPLHPFEGRKWLLAVTSLEATNSSFNVTHENKSFLTTTPGQWSSRGGAEKISKLQKLLEMRDVDNTELHVKVVRKRGNQIKRRDKDYKICDLLTRKN